MIDGIIIEDLEKIKSVVKGDVFEGKKVLITGGAGFIGSWLCEVLISFGSEITSVDDFSTGRIKNIDHLLQNPKFKLERVDASVFQSREKFDLILHLAAHASPEEYQVNPIRTLQASSIGSANVAELARKNDSSIMFTSTSEVYGDAEIVPTPEDYWGKVNPIGPRSCYDEGKRYAEALFVAYRKQYGLNFRIPRIFNTYGPRLREDGFYGRAMSKFITQALTNQPITVYGDGKQTRSFCYVADIVTGLMLLAANDNARGEVVNVGNSQELTILELAKRIIKVTKCKSSLTFHPLPEDDPKRRCPDTNKLERLTGWKPKTTLEDGLKRTIAWFSTQQSLKSRC